MTDNEYTGDYQTQQIPLRYGAGYLAAAAILWAWDVWLRATGGQPVLEETGD